MTNTVKIHSPNQPGITVTLACARHLLKLLQKQPGSCGFRLCVKKAGCSGFKYDFCIILQPNENDMKFVVNDSVTVFVARESYPYLKGTELDLKVEGLNEKLIFNNPNVQNACGCGESFNLPVN